MDVSSIIYYTREDGKGKTLSLRSLCLKQDDPKLESIFYAVKDATDGVSLLDKLQTMCFEEMSLESEEESHVLLKVIDAYQNVNFLKLKKRRVHYGNKVAR